MNTLIGITLLLAGLPLITVAGLVLRFWVRGRDEQAVFGVMLVLGVAAVVCGVALLL
jgi:hypothetical protein